MEEGRHRLSIDISFEQFVGLQRIPWGLKRVLFSAIIDDLLEIIKTDRGRHFIMGIVSRAVNLQDFVRSEDGYYSRPQEDVPGDTDSIEAGDGSHDSGLETGEEGPLDETY